MKPLVDSDGKIVIMGDFNVPVADAVSPFVCFMETLFGCRQHICQPTTDHESLLDLIFSNCDILSTKRNAMFSFAIFGAKND